MDKKYPIIFLILLFVITLTHQDLSAQYQVQDWVIGSGGGTVSGESFTITSTFGQPLSSLVATAGDENAIHSGFWYLTGSGTVTSVDDPEVELPEDFTLNQNYPNPFNPTTKIEYQLPVAADVTIEVYNTIGQRVATLVNESMKAGTHTVSADLGQLSSGVYIYRIVAQGESDTFTSTRKMTLIK